jgi:hypothetical protein
MFTESRIVTGMAVFFGFLLAAATPELGRDAKVLVWVLYAGVCYGFVVYWAGKYATTRHSGGGIECL